MQVLAWEIPWGGSNPWQVVTVVGEGGRPEIPATLPGPDPIEAVDVLLPPYEALMRRCWAQNPAERPGFQEVIAALRCADEASTWKGGHWRAPPVLVRLQSRAGGDVCAYRHHAHTHTSPPPHTCASAHTILLCVLRRDMLSSALSKGSRATTPHAPSDGTGSGLASPMAGSSGTSTPMHAAALASTQAVRGGSRP